MKKILTVLTVVAVALSFGSMSFSACKCNKRPVEMNKSEKIQKKIEKAKEKAKEEAKKAEEETSK